MGGRRAREGVSRLGESMWFLHQVVSLLFVTSLSHAYTGCFRASMHVLYPERLLFSLTKDIRIKLILYYQTLYTTEVANNTEFKERRWVFFF